MGLWTVAGRGASGINKVEIRIGANTSNYWAVMRFIDQLGTVHERNLKGEQQGTINSNLLVALTKAIKALNRPCMLDIHTEADYIVSAFRLGWLSGWKRNGWKTAKQKEVRNKEQWQELDTLLAVHSVKFIKIEAERKGRDA